MANSLSKSYEKDRWWIQTLPVVLLCIISGVFCVQIVQSINTELSLFFGYHRFAWTIEMPFAFCIIIHHPNSISFFERDRMVSFQLARGLEFIPARDRSYPCSAVHWDGTNRKVPERRFYLISFSSLQLLKCSYSGDQQFKVSSLKPRNRSVSAVGCLNTKRMQQHLLVIL